MPRFGAQVMALAREFTAISLLQEPITTYNLDCLNTSQLALNVLLLSSKALSLQTLKTFRKNSLK